MRADAEQLVSPTYNQTLQSINASLNKFAICREDTEALFCRDDIPDMYKLLGIKKLKHKKDYSICDRYGVHGADFLQFNYLESLHDCTSHSASGNYSK